LRNFPLSIKLRGKFWQHGILPSPGQAILSYFGKNTAERTIKRGMGYKCWTHGRREEMVGMFCAGMKETERQKTEFEVRNLDKKGDEKIKIMESY
jgi:hypothetical protein